MFEYNLTKLRKSKKMTQSEMGDTLDVARTTYSSYEQGRRMPDAEIQNKIADFFNVTLDFLHGRDVSAPNWATDKDVLDLRDMLDSNVNTAYGGEELTDEEKQRVKDVLTGIFWKKLQKQKGL